MVDRFTLDVLQSHVQTDVAPDLIFTSSAELFALHNLPLACDMTAIAILQYSFEQLTSRRDLSSRYMSRAITPFFPGWNG